MTVYPNEIDSDADIGRVDDNIVEIGGQIINQLRDAVFALETELGIAASGSADSVADRLDVSLNPDGTIKYSALNGIGLVSLPITNSQVGTNANISESKLNLIHSTSDLYTLIIGAKNLLNQYVVKTQELISNLIAHIGGSSTLLDGNPGKHILSHVLINQSPVDPRDLSYIWGGLKDKDGNDRTATHAMQALDQINTDLINHENSISEAHNASAIAVDTTQFIEIPESNTDAQKVFNYLDQAEVLNVGLHRAVEHVNCIPKTARSHLLNQDGYSTNIVEETPVITYLVYSGDGPNDSISSGDDVISFNPVLPYLLDSQFSKIKVGDIINVNYSNGLKGSFPIVSVKYVPGSMWFVRINGNNLCDGAGTASISRPLYDDNVFGVLAAAYANPAPTSSYNNILPSLILGNPKAATALGIGFDPNQLDQNHYKLYLEFYPTGDPSVKKIQLPAIDVTGNAGVTPGLYTLESVVKSINKGFRTIGYNYRFIAFSAEGQIGIMLSDAINNASFAIISGLNSSGTLVTSTYTKNVVGGNDITTDDFDALGLGANRANIASAAYDMTQFGSESGAQQATKIISPLAKRHFIVNGRRRDTFGNMYLANADGYWDATITDRIPVGLSSIEVEYTVNIDLSPAGLKAGKTITVQPTVSFQNPQYSDVDYGRFIIKDVVYSTPCGGDDGYTKITVINGIHATGNGYYSSAAAGLPVKLYFSYDSVGFDIENLVDISSTSDLYNRYHEIFINDHGKTFSYERARMPRQSLSGTLLDTNKWQILSVSPKLRGYRGPNPLVFNKYLRVKVLSYDSDSGEFTIQMGQPNTISSAVMRPGLTVTGRKNVPVKIYDETNVDFIELMFVDNESPGTTITASRIVDIEIFPSLNYDQELMLLASCEVCWPAISGQEVIRNLRDLRQFGSVGENNFTQSATEFLTVADRELHQNGVIRGYEFDSVSAVNPLEAYFDGGSALVNGKVVVSNNLSVVIPNIRQFGDSLGTTYNWAVCVNESGILEPILITSSKDEFFATVDGVNSYYVPSTTFAELINTRRDLTPIYIAAATIDTVSSLELSDVRKFVFQESSDINLSWSDEFNSASFKNILSIKNWVNFYKSTQNNIKLKGYFVDTYDFTGFNYPTCFEGDGAIFESNSATCITIGNNIHLKNIKFIYNPSSSYTASDNVNSGEGCIYGYGNLDNIKIEDCNFECSLLTAQRHPFVNFEMATNQIISNIVISGNKFNDGYATSNQSAIAIVNNNTGGNSNPALLLNCFITNNICNYFQNIVITSPASLASYIYTFGRPGLSCINVAVTNNIAGSIGYDISSVLNIHNSYGKYIGTNLIIKHNSANFIGTLTSTGKNVAGNFITHPYGSGNVIITENNCNWISAISTDYSTNNEKSSVVITKNNLLAYDYDHLTSNYGTNAVNNNIAIAVVSTLSDVGNSIVMGNKIDSGVVNGTSYNYLYGILTTQSSYISQNIIKGVGIAGSGRMIVISPYASGPKYYYFSITNNQLFRESQTIDDYIALPSSSTYNNGIIAENIFDSTTVDGGSNTALITGAAISGWGVFLNRNYTLDKIYVSTNSIKFQSPITGTMNVTADLNTSGDTVIDGTLRFNTYPQYRTKILTGATASLSVGEGTSDNADIFVLAQSSVGQTITLKDPTVYSVNNHHLVRFTRDTSLATVGGIDIKREDGSTIISFANGIVQYSVVWANLAYINGKWRCVSGAGTSVGTTW